jgi:hypothetical protein
MLTTILKLAALASFVASIAVIIIYVPDPSLIAVVMIVIAMAIYDFLIRPMLVRNGDNRQR